MEYLMTLPIENFRLFICIANSLEDGCLPRISAANNKDTKTPGPHSDPLCSFPLSFDILHRLDFSTGKRHFSMGRLRWWKWWRIKISALGEQYCLVIRQPKEWLQSLTHLPVFRCEILVSCTIAHPGAVRISNASHWLKTLGAVVHGAAQEFGHAATSQQGIAVAPVYMSAKGRRSICGTETIPPYALHLSVGMNNAALTSAEVNNLSHNFQSVIVPLSSIALVTYIRPFSAFHLKCLAESS